MKYGICIVLTHGLRQFLYIEAFRIHNIYLNVDEVPDCGQSFYWFLIFFSSWLTEIVYYYLTSLISQVFRGYYIRLHCTGQVINLFISTDLLLYIIIIYTDILSYNVAYTITLRDFLLFNTYSHSFINLPLVYVIVIASR